MASLPALLGDHVREELRDPELAAFEAVAAALGRLLLDATFTPGVTAVTSPAED